MSVHYNFYQVDQELLESSNGSILEDIDPINPLLYSGDLSEHIWHAETFSSFKNFIPESIREPIEKFINLFSSLGQFGHPFIFETESSSICENVFIVMTKATQEEYLNLFKNCKWEKIEQLYEEHYLKNSSGESFEYFMECPSGMFDVLQTTIINEGVLVASF